MSAGGPESMLPPGPPPAPPPAAPATLPPLHDPAVKRPLGRTILFTTISMGFYQFFWFYKNRPLVTAEVGGKDDAALQTAGLAVPILQYFIIYWLWRDIDLMRRRLGLPEVPALLYALLSAFVPFAQIVCYILVAEKLNEYWDWRTQGQATTAPTTGGEIAVVVAGAAFFLLYFALMVAVIVFSASSG